MGLIFVCGLFFFQAEDGIRDGRVTGVRRVLFRSGTICATVGEDREIRIWDVATGQLKFKLSDHKGPVASLQFTSQDQLVSAGKDNAIMLWSLGTEARPPDRIFPKRSGEVAVLGASPDGKRVLYDAGQSKALRVLSLPE